MELKQSIYNCIGENIERNKIKRRTEYERWRVWSDDSNKKIIVFGASAMCGICMNHFEEMKIKVDCICSNDSSQHGEFLTTTGKHIKIVSVDDAMDDAKNSICFIATGSGHFDDIRKQLKKYGLRDIIMYWNMGLYLEMTQLLLDDENSFVHKIAELLEFYDDEESLKVLFAHFEMLLELENIPNELKKISMDNTCVKPQYFLKNGKYLGRQKVMIDCGAYIGDTLDDLLNTIQYDDFDRYECYEMDFDTCNRLKKNVSAMNEEIKKKIDIYNVGVGEENEEVSYSRSNIGESSLIPQNGNAVAKVVRLDDQCERKQITFLKMDIEGSEQGALKGCSETIKRCKPMCAICIYHRVMDFWLIPQLLKSYVPEYHLILRHHSTDWEDSVCYAKIGAWE